MNLLYYLNRLLAFIMTAIIISLACPLQAAPFPITPYTAHYKVYLKGCPVGESVHELALLPNGLYRFVTTTQPYLSIVPFRFGARTDFHFEHPTIIPQDYFYNTQELRRNKSGQVHFNWKTLYVENRDTLPNWEAALAAGMQDKVSHSLQLRVDLIHGKRHNFTYTVVEESKILPYNFVILEEERLKTPIGVLNTFKTKHIDHKNQVTFTWLAIDYEYLPVKIEHYRKGKKVGSGEIISYT